MTTLTRVTEIVRQEQEKSAIVRILEWAFCYRPGIRKYERYTEERFNPLSGKVE